MRRILVSGGSVLTTNAIARQLFLYSSLLADQQRTDVVDFPVSFEGEATNCTLLVGAQLALTAVTVPRTEAGTLPGEDSALFELQRRCDDVRTLTFPASSPRSMDR